jgi:ketosteroid isomerase-like protein
MRNAATAAAVLLLLLPLGCTQQEADMDSNLDSLVEAERAFAQASADLGLRDAFLEYLGEGAIDFRPEPGDAREYYEAMHGNPGRLTWGPVFADVSRAGDLGYTTGPWAMTRSTADGDVTYHGHYTSVWKREAGGPWKVALDIGIGHGEPEGPAPELAYAERGDTWAGPSNGDEPERRALFMRDSEYSALSELNGFAETFRSHSQPDIRVYRGGMFPVLGQDAALEAIGKTGGTYAWAPMAAGVSSSADLGYTYGLSVFTPGDSGDESARRESYLRIWKRNADGEWRLVLDAANVLPPEEPPAES